MCVGSASSTVVCKIADNPFRLQAEVLSDGSVSGEDMKIFYRNFREQRIREQNCMMEYIKSHIEEET